MPEGMEDWEELEDNIGPEVSTGGVEWGERALVVVQQLLAGGSEGGAAHAELADIQLFSFRAIPSAKRLDIRLDKLTGAEQVGLEACGAAGCVWALCCLLAQRVYAAACCHQA